VFVVLGVAVTAQASQASQAAQAAKAAEAAKEGWRGREIAGKEELGKAAEEDEAKGKKEEGRECLWYWGWR